MQYKIVPSDFGLCIINVFSNVISGLYIIFQIEEKYRHFKEQKFKFYEIPKFSHISYIF
jgi:hypothetical protein